MLGVIDSLEYVTRSTFRVAGDTIVLLGDCTSEIGGSEYLATIHGVCAGAPPACDIERERAVIESLLAAIHAGVIASAHDCSDGGLAVAIAECVMAGRDEMTGADVDLGAWDRLPTRALLFGEAQGRIIVSTGDPSRVLQIAEERGVPARAIGTVLRAGDGLTVRTGARSFHVGTETLAAAYHESIPHIMETATQSAALEPLDGAVV
jgi:phosphoribosylformylglycinamidine synthase